MLIRRWTLLLTATVLLGQDAAPFGPPPRKPWEPAWELTLKGDKLSDPGTPSDSFQRTNAQLRLRWSGEWDFLRVEGGLRAAIGSDGNQFNDERWDQQWSNGTELDVARLDASWASARTFGTLSLGFQANGLMTSEALWDRDLRFLGVGGITGLRDTEGLVQEASVRMAAGRVRNILGGDVDLVAGQLVLKLDTGPLSWAAHADRWNLTWDPGQERLRRLPGYSPTDRQQLSLDAYGLGGRWNSRLPLEVRWFGSRNRENGQTSEETQVSVGSRERVYWPQLSYTYQQLSSTGTLYPVNGDEWWFYRRARGSRVDFSVPLPRKWLATLVYLRQQADGEDYQVARTMLILLKRF